MIRPSGAIRPALLAPAVALALVGLALVGPTIGAAPAMASQGSVPTEVRSYVATGLVPQLIDLYGPGANDTGIDFDATTAATAIWRIFGWSKAQAAGEHPDDPLELENQWAVPVSVADAPLGVAIVWINPDTGAPELASFSADAAQATALSAVPDAASLVHDEPSGAWFALEGGVLTPLVVGSSGIESPRPLADIESLAVAAPAGKAVSDEPGVLRLTIGIIVGLLAIVAAVLLIRRRLAGRGSVG